MINIKLTKHKTTNVKVDGTAVKEFYYTCSVPVKQQVLVKELDKQRKQFIKAGINGRFQVVTKFEGLGWKPSMITDFHDPIRLYHPNDYQGHIGDDVPFNNKVLSCIVYIYPAAPNVGGCDERSKTNDCLHTCLKQAFGDKGVLPEKLREPRNMKKFLEVPRNDPVSIELIPKLEKLCKVAISVTGDHEYTSGETFPLSITLSLINGHYDIVKSKKKKHLGVLFYPRKKENVRTYYNDGTCVYVCDGKLTSSMKYQEFYDMDEFSSKYLMIKSSEAALETDHAQFIKDADLLLELSDKSVNMYKYKDAASLAIDTFLETAKLLKEPEPIEIVEATILKKAAKGGLMYAKKGYEGYGISYDANSRYPYILQYSNFYIVMNKGVAETMTAEQFNVNKALGHFAYGLHHVKVYQSKNDDYNKLFLFSKNDDCWYTHFDLKTAFALGLQMDIIEDGQCNVYSYITTEKFQSKKIFGAWVNKFYDLKLKGAPVKPILSSLWGKLSEGIRTKQMVRANETYDVPKDKVIQGMMTFNEDDRCVYMRPVDKIYKTDYARVGPFLTAFSRMLLVRQMLPFAKHIIRVHTDSVMFDEDIKHKLPLSKKLGDFKIETKKSGKVIHMKNVNSITVVESL